jgi:superkiller protein 3
MMRYFRSYLLGAVFFVEAQHAAPHLGNPFASQAQSSRESQSQKLKNPLNDLLEEAQAAIDKNNFEAAILPLQKFLSEKPEVAYAHFQLAYAYTGLKRGGEARAEYERAIALDPKMAEAYLNLGTLLLNDQKYMDAIPPLRKAVDLLPAQSHPRYLLAVAQDRSGDEAAATASFEALLHLDPNDFSATNYLGWAALRKHNPGEAETKFRRALEIQPNNTKALEGLAQALDAEKKPEAADAYRSYLAVAPTDSYARARLIHLLIDQQQNDAALAELDRVDAGKPASLESLKLRADIQIAQKKYDDAIVTLQQALALAPRDPQLIAGLGRTYLQKRDFASAEKQLKAALQIDPKNVAYWKDLSSTYYLSGDCPKTLAALDFVAKMETPAAGSWFIRGLCYDKLHQVRPALDAYEKFLTLDQGKNSDQVWQAQQRTKVLKHMLEEKR